MKKIKILGEEYKLYTKVNYDSDKELKELFGYCSFSEKKIVVGDLSTYNFWKDESIESRERQERLTLRHEIIHAFLNESGLCGSSNAVDCWARNEEMVDWIAIQYPKINQVFKLVGCED